MLKEETLRPTGNRTFEEPDGEFLQVIDRGSNTISVLSRVEAEDEEVYPPFDPKEYSVKELRQELEDGDFSADELQALLDAEKGGKGRKTAVIAIEDCQ